MPRKAEGLSAQGVKAKNTPGRYGDGNGLYLLVRQDEEKRAVSKFWLFRYVRDGRMREMGLGPASGGAPVALADARRKARALLDQIRDGRDPLAEKLMAKQARLAEAAKAMTFAEAAEKYITAQQPGWKNAKHGDQWRATLATYVYPIIGKLPVQAVDVALVLKVIEPIWTSKTETASRVRGRIESVLDWATARGYRSGDNPARWKGHLETLLPAKGTVTPVEHHPALPYAEMGAFMSALRAKDSVSARALEFTILTAVRTNATLGARLDQIDLATRMWIVRERLKGRKGSDREHRVPLSARAIEIIDEMKRAGATEILFRGASAGGELSAGAMSELLKGMVTEGGTPWMDPKLNRPAVVHGFRSTFEDWATERTSYPSEVRDMALAHTVSDKVEAAYRRGDLFEKRRRFMEEWSRFCATAEKSAKDNVAALRNGSK
jgi:integrase